MKKYLKIFSKAVRRMKLNKFLFANSGDPNQWHLGLQCLPLYPFRGFMTEMGKVSHNGKG